MAATKFVIGKPPFSFSYLAAHLAQDADFLDDAKQILGISHDAYLRLATQLAQSSTFLSRPELKAAVTAVLGEDSDRIAQIIYGLGDIVYDADMDVMEAMDALSKAIEENAEGLEPQQRRTLAERLRKLVAEPKGLAKQFKAQRLVGATGAELDDFRIICDIRPIFDQKHERIDGAVPLATLHLEYTTADGDSAVVELNVTEKQIASFGERIADARLKLRMIKDLLASNDIVVPRTKSTIVEGES